MSVIFFKILYLHSPTRNIVFKISIVFKIHENYAKFENYVTAQVMAGALWELNVCDDVSKLLPLAAWHHAGAGVTFRNRLLRKKSGVFDQPHRTSVQNYAGEIENYAEVGVCSAARTSQYTRLLESKPRLTCCPRDAYHGGVISFGPGPRCIAKHSFENDNFHQI